MDEFEFWQRKINQFFHDPQAKPFAGLPGLKMGQKKLSRDLLKIAAASVRKDEYWNHNNSADYATAGADRPMLDVPQRKGIGGLGFLQWSKYPLITHPLSGGYSLSLDSAGRIDTDETPERKDYTEYTAEDRRDWARQMIEEHKEAARLMAERNTGFDQSPQAMSGYFFAFWRRYRDDLAARDLGGPLWLELPADSRCPDHSIWDHQKVTTALAFMAPHGFKDPITDQGTAREPWMLRVSLGPVGDFIKQARTSRDLWISSFLLSDLAWHAMRPLVERYGPDCIVYPDLRANPRVDVWLALTRPEVLPEDQRDPATYAAVLPDAFVALVPRGGAGHLQPLEDLGEACKRAVEQRWADLHGCVKTWLEKALTKPNDGRGGSGVWQAIWDRQCGVCPIHVTWVAVPWQPLERIRDPRSLRGQSLPYQALPKEGRDEDRDHDRGQIRTRRERLSPWVARPVWSRYELAREVFSKTYLDLVQSERGFDYALTHHMLRMRHGMRDATHPAPVPPHEEGGEKCTLCGEREALHDGHRLADTATLHDLREGARAFWANPDLDPDGKGEERLCAVCATKRFLVKADQTRDPQTSVLNVVWAGPGSLNKLRDRDGALRVPFPSTATVAAQAYLARITTDPSLAEALEGVRKACRAAGLPRTSFPRALPRLAAAAATATQEGGEFLEYEAEDVLFPEVLDGKARSLRSQGKNEQAEKLRDLETAVRTLRDQTNKANIAPPGTTIAVLHMDGDGMGKLLAGDDGAIEARWRDVIHPKVVERLAKNAYLNEAGWSYLIDQKRLMGPSLHAFISRALGHFSHRIVPWVVEQEFSGRLIYAGGDDVLCLAPASEAIDIAARLHQLFSAAWVVDTQPHRTPWDWRSNDPDSPSAHDPETHDPEAHDPEAHDPETARQRFVIPLPPSPGEAIAFGRPGQPVAAHVCEPRLETRIHDEDLTGLLLPMLGRGASLSAGVAIAHYKTPLGILVQRAKDLEGMAKKAGGRAIAIGHASRGGDKTRFVIPWGDRDTWSTRPTAAKTLKTVIEGFREGALSGRLPYKLRTLAPSVQVALAQIRQDEENEAEKRVADKSKALLHGLFHSCLEGGSNEATEEAFAVWSCGVDHNTPPPARPQSWSVGSSLCSSKADEAQNPEQFTDGLLVCRALAGEPTDKETTP